MKRTERPETIENRWDILYQDYPEIYDEFASVPSSQRWYDVVRKIFGLRNKIIADIGSGTGKSTFGLARYARFVVGIEPEDAMRELAVEAARDQEVHNVLFKKGRAENIPLEDSSVDVAIAVTAANFYNSDNIKKFNSEAERITRKQGYIAAVESAPGWYGGELAPIILGKNRKLDIESVKDKTFTDLGFKHRDFFTIRDYLTVNKAVRTYGFIFGKRAIEYLKKRKKTTIKFKGRIYYRRI